LLFGKIHTSALAATLIFGLAIGGRFVNKAQRW
jgi:hypothetical protein